MHKVILLFRRDKEMGDVCFLNLIFDFPKQKSGLFHNRETCRFVWNVKSEYSLARLSHHIQNMVFFSGKWRPDALFSFDSIVPESVPRCTCPKFEFLWFFICCRCGIFVLNSSRIKPCSKSRLFYLLAHTTLFSLPLFVFQCLFRMIFKKLTTDGKQCRYQCCLSWTSIWSRQGKCTLDIYNKNRPKNLVIFANFRLSVEKSV